MAKELQLPRAHSCVCLLRLPLKICRWHEQNRFSHYAACKVPLPPSKVQMEAAQRPNQSCLWQQARTTSPWQWAARNELPGKRQSSHQLQGKAVCFCSGSPGQKEVSDHWRKPKTSRTSRGFSFSLEVQTVGSEPKASGLPGLAP